MDHIQELAVASMADLTLPDATLQKKRGNMQLYIAEGTPRCNPTRSDSTGSVGEER